MQHNGGGGSPVTDCPALLRIRQLGIEHRKTDGREQGASSTEQCPQHNGLVALQAMAQNSDNAMKTAALHR